MEHAWRFLVAMDLVTALRIIWAVAIAPVAAAALPLPPLAGALLRWLLRSFAGRGKTSNSRILTVPQRFFLHFYVVGTVITTFILFVIWFYAYQMMSLLAADSLSYSTSGHFIGASQEFSSDSSSRQIFEQLYHIWRTVFVLLLMEVQLLRRLYETRFVFKYSSSARMHVMGYFTGICFYIGAPVSLGSSCISEALILLHTQVSEFFSKGYGRFPNLKVDFMDLWSPLLMLGTFQWVGLLIFVWGWLHQLRCHFILGSLREHRDVNEYAIPQGDWFNYVSSPHYLAEIIIYGGILVATGGTDVTVWLLLIFVIANLGFSAVETHRWYHEKFEDYPRSRHAMIPFVF